MEAAYQTPSLASVLQTLAAYVPPASQPSIQQPNAQSSIPEQSPDLEEGEYDPSDFNPITAQPTSQPPPPHPLQPQLAPHSQTPPQTHAQPPPHVHPPLPKDPTILGPNPSTILTYPPALRHMTAKLASNPHLSQRIRHLIATQHQHERQWWTGREELVKKVTGREESRRKLDSALKLVGGHTNPTSHSTDLSPEKELEIYDRKVYRACREMVAATINELGGMEVPFFCVRKEFVGDKGKITEEELGKLRRRMLQLLEDMCGGEV